MQRAWTKRLEQGGTKSGHRAIGTLQSLMFDAVLHFIHSFRTAHVQARDSRDLPSIMSDPFQKNHSKQAVQMLYSRATCLATFDIGRARAWTSHAGSTLFGSASLHGRLDLNHHPSASGQPCSTACGPVQKTTKACGLRKCFGRLCHACLRAACPGVRAELALGSRRRLHHSNRVVNTGSLLHVHGWWGRFHCLTQNPAFSWALHLATVKSPLADVLESTATDKTTELG